MIFQDGNSMNSQTKRSGMYEQTNTCKCCNKSFVAQRRYQYCSAECRMTEAKPTPDAQEGATHDTSNTINSR